ncbi:MAG: diacylglycerol/lipid kinase family protein [Candidatus Coproplasma sp.]
MKYSVLYNPLAGAVNDVAFHEELKKALPDDKLDYYDLTKIEDLGEFFANLAPEDGVIVAGGDGTLNRFVNNTDGLEITNRVYYYAAGSGNDFWHDLGKAKGDKPVLLTNYIKDLPTVTVNGKISKFINGVGYGIDGYCCEVGDKLKADGKEVNYTGIAIKGLLFHFKPCNATVIVDGVTKTYKKVWIAPAMLGRFYGGGMMPTPEQDRLSAEKKLSICLFHGSGKIKTLMIFPSLFKGEHVKKQKNVQVLSGKEITVKFDKPCALQIDGETVLNVLEYTAKI